MYWFFLFFYNMPALILNFYTLCLPVLPALIHLFYLRGFGVNFMWSICFVETVTMSSVNALKVVSNFFLYCFAVSLCPLSSAFPNFLDRSCQFSAASRCATDEWWGEARISPNERWPMFQRAPFPKIIICCLSFL